MEREAKKQWLRRYLDAEGRRQDALDQIELCRARATSITGALSGMPGGGHNHDKIPQSVERLESMMQQYMDRAAECVQIMAEVDTVIDGIRDEMQQRILRRRYIFGQKWQEIASAVYLEERQVRRIHDAALDALTCP